MLILTGRVMPMHHAGLQITSSLVQAKMSEFYIDPTRLHDNTSLMLRDACNAWCLAPVQWMLHGSLPDKSVESPVDVDKQASCSKGRLSGWNTLSKPDVCSSKPRYACIASVRRLA